MMDGQMGDRLRLGHPQIDGGTDVALRVGLVGAVMGDAAAFGTEVKRDAGFVMGVGGSHIGARGAGECGAITDQIIGPQHAIAAADGAVAGGGGVGRHIERPAGCAAMTGSFDHRASAPLRSRYCLTQERAAKSY